MSYEPAQRRDVDQETISSQEVPRRRPLEILVQTFHDLRGLITLADLFAWLGFWLYRGTLRRTMAVGIAMLGLWILGRRIDTGMTMQSAATGTGLILLISCLGGFLLMLISGGFSRYFLQIAEAKGSNLLQEMKKSRGKVHAEALWQHAFEPETRYIEPKEIEREKRWLASHHDELERYLLGRIRRAVDDPPKVLEEPLSRLALTREGWGYLFDFIVGVPMSRAEMHDRFRYDLTMLKDWYDGAPFHHTDNKLSEQFHGNDLLLRARREACLGHGHTIRWSFKRSRQTMWFRFIVRATQLRVASACHSLDRRYPGYTFVSDHFFWPNPVMDQQVAEHAGSEALATLQRMRVTLFHRVFSSKPELAVQLMQRAIHPDFEAASLLRRRVDDEYLLGELDAGWEKDRMCYARAFRREFGGRSNQRLNREIEARRKLRGELTAWLAIHPQVIELTDDPRHARRALEIAVGLPASEFGKVWRKEAPVRPPGGKAYQIAIEIARKPKPYLEMLMAVRFHHTLTRLAVEDYEFYIKQVLEPSTASHGDPEATGNSRSAPSP
ncbi:MAG: hypothetical protein JJU36_08545 [Phycisphaeraceae bacterium]|nr:hypothetical protein [Phycisphaeraceae bacterium]